MRNEWILLFLALGTTVRSAEGTVRISFFSEVEYRVAFDLMIDARCVHDYYHYVRPVTNKRCSVRIALKPSGLTKTRQFSFY